MLIAVVPAFGVLVNFQRELRRERETQAREIALQRAELVSASLENLVEGARQMMEAMSVSTRVRRFDPACQDMLTALRRDTQAYAIVAVLRRDGTPVCGDAASGLTPGALAGLARPLLSATSFVTGSYNAPPTPELTMMTFALPFSGEDGAQKGLVVAGMDLGRLDKLLDDVRRPASGRVIVADRSGVILARAPPDAGAIGSMIPPELQTLLTANKPGAVLSRSADGSQRVIGYVPADVEPAGVFVGVGFEVADLVRGIDRAAKRSYLLIVLGGMLSTLLALVLGYRYLRIPASVLLEAARRWGSGDLSARATVPRAAASEFVGLSEAFNEMAALQQQQRTELQALNDALEIRVADRTRALLASNNRLQVEIAERELTEASLRQAQKLQAVGQLAGGMAHDFNNLLTAILGSLELLRKRLPASDARQSKLIDTATQAVERGARLTAQLLAFSRKQPLLAVSVELADTIHGMAGLLESTLGPSVRLETRIDDELWPATLDPNQFEASILNLALNGRDAMPAGGRLSISATNVTITPASLWSELPPGDYVCITVADSGIGMPPDIVNRAFEPFFTTKAPGKGSGLGLSQVHGMVRQAEGSITIESRPGDGTKVQMLFPRSVGDAPRQSNGIDFSQPALERNEAVLLVDDDEQVREVTEAILAESGYAVLTAADGLGALNVLESDGHRIGLVIADYAMPGMTGRELLEVVRQRWPGAAILLATGYADYPELTCRDLPIDQIIRKPFRSNELLARIHMVVQRHIRRETKERGLPVN